MIYKVNYTNGVIEFVKNKGRAYVEADSPRDAIARTRELFEPTREEQAQSLGNGQFLVTFKVTLDYRMPLVRTVEKAIKRLRAKRQYDEGRYIDRYIMANLYKETAQPEYLEELDIREEISSLRKAAVVAREVPSVMSFIDIDIAIHNYVELNAKEGYQSRIVRKVRA
jgi:hypothetical protein